MTITCENVYNVTVSFKIHLFFYLSFIYETIYSTELVVYLYTKSRATVPHIIYDFIVIMSE